MVPKPAVQTNSKETTMINSYFTRCALILISASLLLLASNSALSADKKHGVTHISQEEFIDKTATSNTVFIDVRTHREYLDGYIEGAINIPHTDILNNTALLDNPKNKDIIFYCHSGVRAKKVTDHLRKASYIEDEKLFHLKGDIRAWRARGKPLQSKTP